MHTITQAATALGVTARTLRHYERLGLITPTRDERNDYRLYSDADLAVLRVVVVLRRLGVSLEAVGAMLTDPAAGRIHATLTAAADAAATRAKAGALGCDILTAILAAFDALEAAHTGPAHTHTANPSADPTTNPTAQTGAVEPGARPAPSGLLPAGVAELAAAIDATLAVDPPPQLPPPHGLPVEAAIPEGDLAMTTPDTPTYEPTTPPAGRLTDVRILHLPGGPVAASHVVGPDPEPRAWEQLSDFIRSTDLLTRKPDARLFGFNHPNPTTPNGPHGYEMWLTIPGDLEVPDPLRRRVMTGGTYAAHAIALGDFHEWAWLDHWVMTSTAWEYAGDQDAEHMFGALEEQLNLPALVAADTAMPVSPQLDLLVPVRPAAGGGPTAD